MTASRVPGPGAARIAALIVLAGVLPAATAGAQAASWSAAELALREELAAIEDVLARGAGLSAAQLEAAHGLRERADVEGTRGLRVRSALVAYLAREADRGATDAALAAERAAAADAAERARRQRVALGRAGVVGFRVSLGACALSLGAFNALAFLAERAYGRYAASANAEDAAGARLEAQAYLTAAIAAAGTFAVGLASLLGWTGADATSPP